MKESISDIKRGKAFYSSRVVLKYQIASMTHCFYIQTSYQPDYN